MTSPKVSVLMSVLNGEAYLAEAIDSVLAQTFEDFEFLIVDNASTDGTAAIIAAYDDKRIVHLRNPDTLNLSQSLNKGLAAARGDYIARLDADDIAMPERLEKQARFLAAHPDVALVASAWTDFGDGVPLPGTPGPVPPPDHDALVSALARSSILAHSSIMFRRQAALDIGGYDEAYAYCMDYLLYFRLAETHGLAALPEPLVAVRVHAGQITQRPEWEARRHREAAAAFRDILARGGLASAVRAGLRRYLILTCLRMTLLSLRTASPGKAICWFGRALAVGPLLFICVVLSASCRRVQHA
ncbi:MAG: hypothetical protein COW30_00820 [Rhodospirillales bacterium CG15_BIG_FIL_POST_REV_8_21_14_020_66_15]|nr:MAG: hypothetical protein COW30_00820 [Rhodospirillales bacterium CG15_BIG_FIL_POST_REV_8_21_14_020_66_15]